MVDLSLNGLLNRLPTLNTLTQLPPALARPQVLEAVVLSSGPLLQPGSRAAAASAGNNQQLVLLVQGEKVAVVSPQPFPRGSTLLVKTEPTGQLTVLNEVRPSPAARVSPEQGLLQQALREILPRQQALSELVPLLRQLLPRPERAPTGSPSQATVPPPGGTGQNAPASAPQLPPGVSDAVQQLLSRLPTPQQLQQPAGVKAALRDSGPLLEAKLARLATAGERGADRAATTPPAVDRDIKAQVARLLQQLPADARTPETTPARPAPATGTAATAPEQAPLYRPSGMLAGQTTPEVQAAPRPEAPTDPGTDVVLRQLGKLLLSALARTQINQLDSVATRLAAPTADPQQPVNSWVLELPILQGERQDNLQLRIDQYRGGADGAAAQRQWTVDLAFDLHASGKLQVQLKILGSSVAGNLWTEREALHRQARAHLDDLRRGLESAGVQVTELNCHHGLPVQRGPRWQQQLVDLKT